MKNRRLNKAKRVAGAHPVALHVTLRLRVDVACLLVVIRQRPPEEVFDRGARVAREGDGQRQPRAASDLLHVVGVLVARGEEHDATRPWGDERGCAFRLWRVEA